ncbi:PLP-dependent aminotransferase family protein [Maribacter sp. 2-571]|uniref:MocR-like pyridoxine biosynthesis transcription factor PdxR n=1 Tax=Maribacter sp. 2-571 TaxID=3417569 RepID=UPI003D332BE8
MIPYKTTLQIDRSGKQPIYLQLANQFVGLIKKNVLVPGAKLPGSRTLAAQLSVHRKTVIACYDDLLLQGWIVSIPKKGTFVHQNIPTLQKRAFIDTMEVPGTQEAGFSFFKEPLLERPLVERLPGYHYLNDGVSDVRLTPMKAIAKEYRSLADRKNSLRYLGYDTTYGNPRLREVLVTYLNETRGLHITKDQLLITRGSQMAMYLAARTLMAPNTYVVVGETNYIAADLTFQHAGATLLRVPVDENGLNTDAIAHLCKKHDIKAVYVTSHHHHPTTVMLSAERRMQLLNLARTHRFAIIEDDYDYDFHYDHSPILPLASHDANGNVIYVGSVCKTVAPVYRVGYLVAPRAFVDQCAKLRRFVDRQGDSLLEAAFANFIKSGDLDRHIRKVLKHYALRRALFCTLLEQLFGTVFTFEIPKGGMAVWVRLQKGYEWRTISEQAKKHGLIIGEWQRYDMAKTGHNGIRMGFAAYNEEEIRTVLKKLHLAVQDSIPKKMD